MSHNKVVLGNDEKQLEEFFGRLQNEQIIEIKVPDDSQKKFWVTLIPGKNYKTASKTFSVTFVGGTAFYFEAYVSQRPYFGSARFWVHFYRDGKTRRYGADKFMLQALKSSKVLNVAAKKVKQSKKRQVEIEDSSESDVVVLYESDEEKQEDSSEARKQEERPVKKRDMKSDEVEQPKVDAEVEQLAIKIIISCDVNMQAAVNKELREKYEREFKIVKPAVIEKYNRVLAKEFDEKFKTVKNRVIQELSREFDEKNAIIVRMQSQQANPFIARMGPPDISAIHAVDSEHQSEEEHQDEKFVPAQPVPEPHPTPEMLAKATKFMFESDTIMTKAKTVALERWSEEFKTGIFQMKTDAICAKLRQEYEARLEKLEHQYKVKYHDEIYNKKAILKQLNVEKLFSLSKGLDENEKSLIDQFLAN
jgi:hypothetical protein